MSSRKVMKVSEAKTLLTGSFFSPPDPPDAIVPLTESRKQLIWEFKARPGSFRYMGSEAWNKKLFQFLHKKDQKIGELHVKKWIETHPWITKPSRAPSPATQEEDEVVAAVASLNVKEEPEEEQEEVEREQSTKRKQTRSGGPKIKLPPILATRNK